MYHVFKKNQANHCHNIRDWLLDQRTAQLQQSGMKIHLKLNFVNIVSVRWILINCICQFNQPGIDLELSMLLWHCAFREDKLTLENVACDVPCPILVPQCLLI